MIAGQNTCTFLRSQICSDHDYCKDYCAWTCMKVKRATHTNIFSNILVNSSAGSCLICSISSSSSWSKIGSSWVLRNRSFTLCPLMSLSLLFFLSFRMDVMRLSWKQPDVSFVKAAFPATKSIPSSHLAISQWNKQHQVWQRVETYYAAAFLRRICI